MNKNEGVQIFYDEVRKDMSMKENEVCKIGGSEH